MTTTTERNAGSDAAFRVGQYEVKAAQQRAAGTRCRECGARAAVSDGRVGIPHLQTCRRYRPRGRAPGA